MKGSDFLTTGTVARMAPLSATRVVQLADKGEIRCLRLSNGYRVYLRADVEEFLAARRQRTSNGDSE